MCRGKGGKEASLSFSDGRGLLRVACTASEPSARAFHFDSDRQGRNSTLSPHAVLSNPSNKPNSMPKASSTKKGQPARHAPFVAQLAEEDQVQKFGRVSKPGKRAKKGLDDDEDENEQTVRLPSFFRGSARQLRRDVGIRLTDSAFVHSLVCRSQAAPDAKDSRRILELAREQQDEMDLLLEAESGMPAMADVEAYVPHLSRPSIRERGVQSSDLTFNS